MFGLEPKDVRAAGEGKLLQDLQTNFVFSGVNALP